MAVPTDTAGDLLRQIAGGQVDQPVFGADNPPAAVQAVTGALPLGGWRHELAEATRRAQLNTLLNSYPEGAEPGNSGARIGVVCHYPGMGRHARGAAHLRVSVSTVVLGTLIVTVVAVGSLLSSHAQPTPMAADGAAESGDGTAVVVSSLACQDGAGGTQVDVLSPAGLPVGTTVRATLDACGYQEGEQLFVRFAANDPTKVALLGNAVDETTAGGRLLPYGLVSAALLAAGAAAAVFLDARRGRRTRALTPRANDIDPDGSESGLSVDSSIEAGASGNSWSTPAVGALGETMLRSANESPDPADSHRRPVGRHARQNTDRGERTAIDHSPPASPPRLLMSHLPVAVIEPEEPVDRAKSGDREPTTVDLSFPFTVSLSDCLRDELFTHRTVRS